MRILLTLESYLPNISGVVIFTKRLATFLSSQGHRVLILTTSPSGISSKEKDPADFSIYRVRGWKNPFRKDLRISYPWDYKEIENIVREFSPDLVHLQDIGILCQMALKASNILKIPAIAHHHFSMEYVLSYIRLKFLHPFLRFIVKNRGRKYYNKCKLVITPTEFSKKSLMAWGIKTKIVVVSNGVELERFIKKDISGEKMFMKRFNIKKSFDVVIYTGRLDKDKNIWTLIKAIPFVLEKIPEAHFLFVGDGTERKYIESWVKHQKWNDKVHFVGFISHEDPDLPRFYQFSDILWTASTIETQSITTLEGMASGLPVVAAKAGALPELVHEGENGFLVDPYDPMGFADAAVSILKNKSLAKTFSEKSREIASGHDIKESFYKIFELYREAVGEEEHPV
jgi:glycosyltransferase involved in cell wall biosynthesis